MKLNKSVILSLVVLVIISAVYRIVPNRPLGFAPQLAIALFSGALFQNNKKWAFAMPLFSMLLSDGLYELLYMNGLSSIKGFYRGQWQNYLLIIATACFGFAVKMNKISSIVLGGFFASTAYFIVSNFLVWISGGGYHRPITIDGFIQCYVDALPFYTGSLLGTAFFAALLFGGMFIIEKSQVQNRIA
ncbi:MAG: DUF6580 family putative transport protein [Chitinophagaceae bacterium]